MTKLNISTYVQFIGFTVQVSYVDPYSHIDCWKDAGDLVSLRD